MDAKEILFYKRLFPEKGAFFKSKIEYEKMANPDERTTKQHCHLFPHQLFQIE